MMVLLSCAISQTILIPISSLLSSTFHPILLSRNFKTNQIVMWIVSLVRVHGIEEEPSFDSTQSSRFHSFFVLRQKMITSVGDDKRVDFFHDICTVRMHLFPWKFLGWDGCVHWFLINQLSNDDFLSGLLWRRGGVDRHGWQLVVGESIILWWIRTASRPI